MIEEGGRSTPYAFLLLHLCISASGIFAPTPIRFDLRLKPVFHEADFSARSAAAVVIAFSISNNGHFWSLRYARI